MNWILSTLSWLFAPALPQTKDPLANLVSSSNVPLGPMPVTGGVIHSITAQTAQLIANLIRKYAKSPLTIDWILAWLTQESRCDNLAENPNHQDAKPGESAADAFRHTDIGIAQFDGATLLGLPEFAGKTIDQVKTAAFNPDWAISYFVQYANSLIAWANNVCSSDQGALRGCGGDPNRLAVESYNRGRTGALTIARKGAYNPLDWAYANKILTQRDVLAKTLS